MKIAFRTDASLQIGTGHVMRCLTLADALKAKGASCHFICREHEGNLIEFVRAKGYTVHVLLLGADDTATLSTDTSEPLAHGNWLGATQEEDASACLPVLKALQPDWMVVDHYALDVRWERVMASCVRKLMVIDDLADRIHDCDLLLDQTFGRDADDYRALVPSRCTLLCGSRYALLRPEFAMLRDYSLKRRVQPRLRDLLITMGGVDKDNATGQILKALRGCPLPTDCRITVVMGASSPWIEANRDEANDMPWQTQVLAGVSDMAMRMADCDLAIGAAGATSWERCCLGVPTIMLVLAENQRKVATELERFGAAKLGDNTADSLVSLITSLVNDSSQLSTMSTRSLAIVDGSGVFAVMEIMEA